MPLDSQEASQEIREENLGSLRSCLVEGDAEQRNRERRVRRRALAISILIQTAVLALLVLLPLFGKRERIALAIPTPVPPYSPYKGAFHDSGAQQPHGQRHNICHLCAPINIPPVIVTHDTQRPDVDDNDAPPGLGLGIPGAPGALIPIPDARTPMPPPPVDRRVARPSILRMTTLTRRC